MTRAPLVSVVLPVYNGERYVRRAVDSILTQTLSDLELIVIDDGSTDGTAALLDAVADPRVRVVHQRNAGLPFALNAGLTLSRGRYVARQDHDDTSLPRRLAAQVAFMEAHSACALLGTRAEILLDDQLTGRAHDHPVGDRALQFALLFDNPFVHSSVMLRREVLQQVGGYATDLTRQPPEDYELWSRIARHHAVANLPERLLLYREVRGSFSRARRDPFPMLVKLSVENLTERLHGVAQRDLVDLAALMHARFELVSPEARLERLQSLLHRAAAAIDPGRTDCELSACCALRRQLLRRRFHFRRPLPRALRSLWRGLKQQLTAR